MKAAIITIFLCIHATIHPMRTKQLRPSQEAAHQQRIDARAQEALQSAKESGGTIHFLDYTHASYPIKQACKKYNESQQTRQYNLSESKSPSN